MALFDRLIAAGDSIKKNSGVIALYFVALTVGPLVAYNLVSLPAQLGLTILLAALLFYPVVRYPTIGIYLLFLFMPFIPYFRKLYYLVHDRPDADPLIVLGDIVAGYIFMGLFFIFRSRAEEDKPVRMISRVISVYLIYVILRSFIMHQDGASSGIMSLRFYAPQVLLFFVGIVFAKNLKLIRNIWIITAILGIAAALYGFKQLFIGYSEAERIWFSSISFRSLFIEGLARPFSFFQSPASFADFLQIAAIAVLILSSWNRKRPLFLVMLPLFAYGILITSVRSNWAGFAISLIAWFTIVSVRGTKSRIATALFLVLAFVGFQTYDLSIQSNQNFENIMKITTGQSSEKNQLDLLVTDRISALANPFQEHSVLSRVALWNKIFAMTNNPINAFAGRGTGALNTDSLYINYLSDFGYPGLIFIIALTLYFCRQGFLLVDRAQDSRIASLAKGLAIFNLTFMIVNITGTHIHSFPGDTFFWFFNGVLVKLVSLHRPHEGEVTYAPADHA